MKKKSKKCLDCDMDLTDSHPNRKRCEKHARLVAQACTAKSIKKWRSRNSDRVKAFNKSWNKKFPIKKRLTHARDIARSRGYKCEITNERFIQLWNETCHYCATPIISETGIGLDRINNSISYIESNVLPCCGSCNYIRGNRLTVQEMEVAMSAVIQYRKSKEIKQQ
jgi:hypothetical protein